MLLNADPYPDGYYYSTDQIQISPGLTGLLADDTANNLPLRYSVSSGGTLYVDDDTTSGKTIYSSNTISSSARCG